MAELSQATAHAHAEGTRAGDAPRATWARGKSQGLEKADASRFISFISQSRGRGAAAPALEGFPLPQGPGKHFPARKLVLELGQYHATSAHKQLPFPSPGAACSSTMDARAAQGQVLGFVCASSGPPCRASTAWCAARWGSQSPRGMGTTTTALCPRSVSLPAPASHPDTHAHRSAWPSRDAREVLRTCR